MKRKNPTDNPEIVDAPPADAESFTVNGEVPTAARRLRRIHAAFDLEDYDAVLRAVALQLALSGRVGGIVGDEETAIALAHICREWVRHTTVRLAGQGGGA